MKKLWLAVVPLVIAGLLVSAVNEWFPFTGGNSSGSTTTSIMDGGNSTTEIKGNSKTTNNSDGTVVENRGSSITNNFNEGVPQPSSPHYGKQTDTEFEIENEPRGGAWELNSPAMNEFSSESERPGNGHRWLPEDTVVFARCAVAGTTYSVKFGNKRSLWRFFAQLRDGKYLPMGDLREATHDGPQGLKPCG